MATDTNELLCEANKDPDQRLSVKGLVSLYHKPLLAWLRHRLSVADDADDVAQETYIRLMKYEGASDIQCHKSMLYKVAANAARDQERMGNTRRRKMHFSIDEEEIEFPSRDPSVDQIVESAEAYQIVCAKIENLPPKCRQVFLLSRMHGMTYPQIAEHCGISIKMVEKHVSHALCVLLKS